MSKADFLFNLAILQRFEPEKVSALLQMAPPALVAPRQILPPEWADSLPLKEITTLFVYGIGAYGEAFFALRPWLQGNEGRTLVFLVDDFAAARSFLEGAEARELLTHQQVVFKLFHFPSSEEAWGLLQKELEWIFKTAALGKSRWASPLNGADAVMERMQVLKKWFQRNLDEWLRTYHVYLVDHKEALDSYYPNLLELLNAKCGQTMRGAFAGLPAVICGAGPSLAQHLDKLRHLQDKALIFGAGSALNVLSRHGIVPHFAGGVDPTPTQLSRVSTNFAFQVPFFFLSRFNHRALHFVQGEKLFMRGGISLRIGEWFEDQLGLALSAPFEAGMSTSTFCLEVALALGCNPITLVGMDLSYKDAQRYAPEVTAHPAEERKHHHDIGKPKANQVTALGLDGQSVTTTKSWLLEAESFAHFCKKSPGTQVWNATEGGLPIEGIANVSFHEVIERELNQRYDFEGRIHEAIQRHRLDFITKDKLHEVLMRWEESLSACKKVLVDYRKVLKGHLDAITSDKELDLPLESFAVDLELLLGDAPAHRYCLKQLNDIFSGLNEKTFFRMAYFPQLYPLWKCAQISGLIGVERCRFLVEKLDEHLALTKATLAQLPSFEMVPRPEKSALREVFVETENSADGRSVRRFYCATGELYAIKRYRADLLDGRQEYFFADGGVRSILDYQEGALDGEVRLYYGNGQPKRELHFKKGQLHGIERLWDETGQLLRESSYIDNQPHGKAFCWHPNGVLSREVSYQKGPGHCAITEWDEKGNLLSTS